jgi:hypothetical protein
VKGLQTTDNRRQTTDDGRQVMAIVHMDLWSRWTKKTKNTTQNSLIKQNIPHRTV